ncbi:terminase small subunit [Ilyobacter polytropus]|uniref:Terminase small subunit n=1 Tax=Ilyobacter polytropus (strain ATCC 51220 / DSM 2926 / LMG 16218 / CuHBu1) TaxID=572544 RepID=E3HBR7_ILYPC|nr:terminase small subunit [Ilyobacter polytropus]ADO83829.1 Terminase small subunit [Ilyobacter polytropus DSM 2926]
MKLTLKQRAFADFYIELANATEAAKRAGYSEKTCYSIGNENLKKPEVKAYIDERLEQIESKRIANASEVLKYLTSVMRGESVAEIVVVEGEGDGCSSARRLLKAPDEKERLKAAELLGKRYSIFTDKLNVEGSIPVIIHGENALEE